MTHRAYGIEHQRTRAKLLAQLSTDTAQDKPWPCPRCGYPMLLWQPLDLGHTDPEAKQAGLPGDRLEHAGCNRAAQDGTLIVQPIGHQPSRDW